MSERATEAAVELEGVVSTLTVLRVKRPELPAIEALLRAKVETMPGFFQDAPVAFDLSDVDGQDGDETASQPCALRLGDLSALARSLGLCPVGVRAPREARRAEAREAGLGVLKGSGRPRGQTGAGDAGGEGDRRPQDASRRSERPLAPPPALTLRQPLRGGQVIYAEGGDAIALAPVNSGAELIADGNIHVYGALRGRALAGAHGDEAARIFCLSLEADLVSIAGTYLRADELPEECRGRPTQIWLEAGQLRLDRLG